MKQIHFILILLLSPFLCQCSNKKNVVTNKKKEEISYVGGVDDKRNEEIDSINRQTWIKVREIIFSDNEFLKTKQPMSNDAIAPYDYHTGLVGDKAYNQIVYLKALERVKKQFSVIDNQLVIEIKSGKEINISEDLYKYIVNLIASWNKGIRDGQYKIIKTAQGYYDISPSYHP